MHRYKTKLPQPALYQIENELNEAFLSSIYGQRLFSFVWGNWTFVTELLATLRMAVKDEDPSALVTMNFHTDVPKAAHDLLHLPGYYLDAVVEWRSYLDVVALDAYPNMYVATPVMPEVVGERIQAVRRALQPNASLSAPLPAIMIMETGFPVLHGNTTTFSNGTELPPELMWSEAHQAAYITGLVDAVRAASGAGVLYFDFGPSNGMLPPKGGYTTGDEQVLTELALLLENKTNFEQVLVWLLEDNHLWETIERAPFFLERADAEGGWGLLDENMKPREGFRALQRAYR